MKIAHLLPYSARFPLIKHNGRYEWALRLARKQAADGHQVNFYAGPGSKDDSSIIWRSIDSVSSDRQKNNLKLISTAFEDSHDIYHTHFDYLHYLLADRTEKPIVYTQHWFPNHQIAKAAQKNLTQNVTAVPSSDFMARKDDNLNIKHEEIIRQGIDLKLFRPTGEPVSERLIFVGRIAPWKGVLEAVLICRASSQALDMVGKLNTSEQAYWKKIEPFIDRERIRYLGPKKQAEIAKLLPRAKAFIFPSQAPEAAPQAPIEAQACGTPVLISDVGASSEWIEPGITGFIAGSQEEFIEAIKNIEKLDRNECRKFAEQFGFEDMATKYETLYERLVGAQQ